MGAGNSGLYNNTNGALKPEHLMDELRKKGVKFNEKDVVMATKTKNDELVWLEEGNGLAGLKHIVDRHEIDLKTKFGVSKENIPSFVKDVFTNGIEKSSTLKNGGYEKVFIYNGEDIVISGVGKNGYIVTIYPK